MRHRLKAFLRWCGMPTGRYKPRVDPAANRQALFEGLAVGPVLDVEPNVGNFASEVRRDGFLGGSISFNRLGFAFGPLEPAVSRPPLSDVLRWSLWREPGVAQINIVGKSWSSSLLPPLDSHHDTAPESAFVGTEAVMIRTLDDVCGELVGPASTSFMKADAHGLTISVLKGGERTLPKPPALQVDLSVVPLYAGEPLMAEAITNPCARSFRLFHIEPESVRAAGSQLQVDRLFVRS